jgi:predicted  nucleic acid-binding Zn-ribbon protein
MDTDPRIVVNALVELAEHEEALAEAVAAVDRSRKRHRSQGELAEEYGSDADAADAGRRTAESGFRRRAREIQDLEASLRAKRDLLVGLVDRRQHRALAEEIGALEQRLDRLETEAYELLDAADAHAGESDEARLGRRKAADRRAAAGADLAAARDRVEAVEHAAAVEIARLLRLLPPDVARHVERLRTRGDRAVAWLQDGACGGCFALLPPQQAIAVGKGRLLVKCASCSRYVVHKPWR